ncbi:hypothetical protein FZEAL_2156 [Fusarium zealandicum]|uniref:Heterokaryon incompatibility domain-containing protein n=1 Tax=Fusarium zealandicum TaxID=1053134 RepID=A0A8H4XNV2_9HYPO|nr:hypothetical protein FZEAL_2156 [Fusarium zealandicum]
MDYDASFRGRSAATASPGRPDLIPQLLEIQKCQIPQRKMIWIIENLECLGLNPPKKRKLEALADEDLSDTEEAAPFWFRHGINGFQEGSFVALSYTWEASEHETQDPNSQGNVIQTRDRRYASNSNVRGSVLERVTKYMQRHQVPLLWIDRYSIPQKVCKQSICKHEVCNKQQHALDAMDRVYSMSDHPVALLGRPIHSHKEMATLAAILNGSLIESTDGVFRLSETTTYEQAKEALQLLYDITRDRWWTRAWTFQENYRAGIKMTLLIHHGPDLEIEKQAFRRNGNMLFDRVPGELSVQSVKFSESATKFCLAFRQDAQKTRSAEEAVQHILTTAGKYTLLLQEESTSMSATIVSDVLARGVTKPWDRLAIIANCCQYSMRLNVTKLQKRVPKGLSLSLSILTLRLLNGEILKGDDPTAAISTPVDQTQDIFFDRFRAPKGEKRLTFNKGCRFVNARLTKEGIQTTGHLWKLEETFKAPRSSPRMLQESIQSQKQLSPYHNARLKQLVELFKARKGSKYKDLARKIQSLIEQDVFIGDDQVSFSHRYRRIMVKELVRAMDADQLLSLGCLWDPATGETISHLGIFILEGETSTTKNTPQSNATHVFTSLWSRDKSSKEYDPNDLDHHVSLGVTASNLDRKGPPFLYAEQWFLGLCFFENVATYDVVFPWPRCLVERGSQV